MAQIVKTKQQQWLDSISLELKQYFDSIAEEKTRTAYQYAVANLGFDLNQYFIECKDTPNKLKSEQFFISWISKNRSVLAPSTLKLRYSVIRSFLTYHDIQLNWVKIRKSLPKQRKGNDRALRIEEIRVLFDNLDLRGKFILSLLASSGVRIGAFDYFKVRDVEPREEYGVLTVYRGEAEEYTTFVSSECVDLFNQYMAERKRFGEDVKPESPLVRNRVSAKNQPTTQIQSESLKNWLALEWKRRGIKNGFKQTHGFRKLFKTALENAGMKTLFVEMLLGHDLGLHGNYIDSMDVKPQLEKLAVEYRNLQHVLWISEALIAKTEVKKVETNVEAQLEKLYEENAKLKRESAIDKAIFETRLAQTERKLQAQEGKDKEVGSPAVETLYSIADMYKNSTREWEKFKARLDAYREEKMLEEDREAQNQE